jgi:hypothetical protein
VPGDPKPAVRIRVPLNFGALRNVRALLEHSHPPSAFADLVLSVRDATEFETTNATGDGAITIDAERMPALVWLLANECKPQRVRT